MNINEFINHNKECPICGSPMIIGLHSNKKQTIRYENGRLTFTFMLEALNKRQKSYRASYSFGLLDYSFQIEFYTKSGEHFYTESPDFLRKRFLELHTNMSNVHPFNFWRECANTSCVQYNYTSRPFSLDFKKGCYEPLQVQHETIGLVHSLPNDKNECRIFRMANDLSSGKTQLFFWKGVPEEANLHWTAPRNTTHLELPLIPFVSKDKTAKRLNNLVVFT